MAEGGGFPWSSRRRRCRRRGSDSGENSNEDFDNDLLRVVLSDSEDFVPEDVKSTTSVACSCASDLQDEQPSNGASCNTKSCPNLIDLDPEARRRQQLESLRRLAKKVTRRKRTKETRKNATDDFWSYERDENGLGYYGRCLLEAKKAREKAEREVMKRREKAARPPRRRRPLSMMSFWHGSSDEETQDARRRRFSFSWGFRRATDDTNLEDTNSDVVENSENLAPSTPPSPPQQVPLENSGVSFEEFNRRRKEKARLKAAQHRFEYFLISDIVSVTNCPWYWGKINRFQAEKVRNSICKFAKQ